MTDPGSARSRLGTLGLWSGPLLALAAGAALTGADETGAGRTIVLDSAGRVTAALAVWMAVWWLSEAVPVYATALLPLAVLPLAGVSTVREVAAPYAHELIFLFLGGFWIAAAMQRWGLHRRIALGALGWVGDAPRRVIGAFMLVSAGLSMWVSNSAAAIMMLPIAVSVIELAGDRVESEVARRHFAVALLLGVAYAASIGGMATPIGTPPNLLLISYAKSQLGREISFARWTATLLPLVLPLLLLTWWLLTRALFRIDAATIEGSAALVRRQLRALGPLTRPESIVAGAFVGAAGLWITRPWLGDVELAGVQPLAGLTDTGIAMLVALALFAAPTGRADARTVLDWHTASRVPWGVLLLFGGGLSLAAAIQDHGVGAWLGASLAGLGEWSPFWILLAVVVLTVFLTELTSNTATTATFVPVLGAVAPEVGLDPLFLAAPAALAASCAFMLPVATPPNAVVFGSGRIGVRDMSRTGFWLNWIAVAAITTFAYAAMGSLGG